MKQINSDLNEVFLSLYVSKGILSEHKKNPTLKYHNFCIIIHY